MIGRRMANIIKCFASHRDDMRLAKFQRVRGLDAEWKLLRCSNRILFAGSHTTLGARALVSRPLTVASLLPRNRSIMLPTSQCSQPPAIARESVPGVGGILIMECAAAQRDVQRRRPVSSKSFVALLSLRLSFRPIRDWLAFVSGSILLKK